MDLEGRGAVVTGGNGGIGLALAESLVAAGARVCIWGRNERRNAEAERRLRAHAGEAWAVTCDVRDPAQVEAAFTTSVDRLGVVSSCFANAGVYRGGTPFVSQTVEDLREVMVVNVEGAFLTLQAAARHMIDTGHGGSLVGVASVAAHHGAARAQAYGASKAALLAVIRACAVELAAHGIRANALLPGWTESAMTEDVLATNGFQDRVLSRIPMQRWGRPEDLGGAAVYLAGDASRFQTGTEMVVDGGYAVF